MSEHIVVPMWELYQVIKKMSNSGSYINPWTAEMPRPGFALMVLVSISEE